MRWIPAKLCWQDDPTALGPRSNATRKEWYHGVKIHAFVMLWPGKLPIPCAFPISQASLCDLWVGKQIDLDCAPVADRKLFADRAYTDAVWKAALQNNQQSNLLRPERKTNGYFSLVPYHRRSGQFPNFSIASASITRENLWILCFARAT